MVGYILTKNGFQYFEELKDLIMFVLSIYIAIRINRFIDLDYEFFGLHLKSVVPAILMIGAVSAIFKYILVYF